MLKYVALQNHQFDFATGEMECHGNDEHPDLRCPGNFKLNCPNEDIGTGFDPDTDCDVGCILFHSEEASKK